MSANETDWFAGIAEVVAEPVKFKLQLAIGEDAYTSLRVKKIAFDVWDTFGAASTAAAVAKSSIVATTFFPSTGLLSVVGIGTAATPVGWVVGAAVVAGGAWIGITRYLRVQTEARAKTIPEFINTPLDIIGLALFDLMAPLVLKVAYADGALDPTEQEKIERWFIRKWGYDRTFVEKGLAFCATRLDEVQIAEIAVALARYKRESPDCNYRAMSEEILSFLREVMEADGLIDEREEMAIECIARVLEDEGGTQLGRSTQELGRKISSSAATAGSAIADGTAQALDATVSGASRLGHAASDTLSETFKRGAASVSTLRAKIKRRKESPDPQD